MLSLKCNAFLKSEYNIHFASICNNYCKYKHINAKLCFEQKLLFEFHGLNNALQKAPSITKCYIENIDRVLISNMTLADNLSLS